tara:strand:+ start:41 stop:499 length:459 start_codon:yes stop_codon:yes gene_type:complete
MDDQETDSISQNNDNKMVMVGSGVRVEGRIEGAESADISGSLSGTLKCSNININSSGNFNGDMSGQDVIISGQVEGEVNSDDSLIVNQSADIKGTIEYSKLQVSYGAKLQGTLRHRGSIQTYTPTPETPNLVNNDEEENIEQNNNNDEQDNQ